MDILSRNTSAVPCIYWLMEYAELTSEDVCETAVKYANHLDFFEICKQVLS